MFQRLRTTFVVGLSSVMFLHGYTGNLQANTQVNDFRQEVKQPQNAEPGAQGKGAVVLNRALFEDPEPRTLTPGEKHTYLITLKTNDLLKLTVEQKGIDVVVRLLGPDKKMLQAVDSPNGTQGPEPLSFIAAQEGDYTLEIESLEKTGQPGKYELKLEPIKTATEQDRAQVEIEQLNAESEKLRQAGKYDQALPLAQKAVEKSEKIFGPESVLLAESLDLLARLCYAKGDDAQAERLSLNALTIREKVLGADHPDVATNLNELAVQYLNKGDYSRAEPCLVKSLTIYEKVLGTSHTQVAINLNNLAGLYQAKGDYARAEPLFVRALAIWEKALVPDHPQFATCLNNLAGLYQDKGDYAQAEPMYLRALAIRERALGAGHPDVANSLNNLAILYQDKGDYAQAEPLVVRALAIREKALGPNHPQVAKSLNNLANLYQDKGDYVRVEPLQVRALEIWKSVLGPDHPQVATCLNNLAMFYRNKGDYARAEPLFMRALAIRENVLRATHPDVSISLNNLAGLYVDKGDYARAEPLYIKALAINENALGADHPSVAINLNNLAGLYQDKGNYLQAEQLHLRALAIREKALGPNHPDVANSLNSLANLYKDKGDYTRAEPLCRRALAIRERALGADHPDVANSLNNLAGLYQDKGDYARAEPLYVRALAINEKALRAGHPDAALSLNNLANLYKDKGDYTQAEPLFVRSLAIFEKVFGPTHPHIALTFDNLAGLYQVQNKPALAVQYLVQGNDATERDLTRNLVSGSENQKALYLRTTQPKTDHTISLHTRMAPRDPVAAQAALTVLLRRKGRALDTMTTAIETLRRNQTPKVQKLLDDYASLNGQISALTLRGPGKQTTTDHLAYLKELNSQREKLEAEISTQSAEFKAQVTPITLKNVQKAIPPDTCLVEYAVYRPYDAKTRKFGTSRYVAYVLKPGSGSENQGFTTNSTPDQIKSDSEKQGSGFRVQGSGSENQGFTTNSTPDQIKSDQPNIEGQPLETWKPEPGTLLWVDLGEAAPIEETVTTFRRMVRDQSSSDRNLTKIDTQTAAGQNNLKAAGRKLEQLIFEPVRKLLGPTTRVLLSPDGTLNLIPFDALVDNNGQYLVETYEFSYLTSGRDLLRLQNRIKNEQPPLVVANPIYGNGKGPHLFGQQFSPLSQLAETATEAKKLKTTFPGSSVFLGNQATKSVLTQARRPEFLHIGTHGYFLPDVKPEVTPETKAERTITLGGGPIDIEKIRRENPLLRSYLFFAGANKSEGNAENDGVLTALEASGLNLWGTKLVVLSACDTGLGDVRNGDGVYGLRRALVLAGSESQMVSLWPVSDAGTRDLMIKYYQLLKAGKGRSQALRQVRLEFLKKPNRKHPFYWASFILSGEWANLDGVRK